ncbi:MAG TPA: type IV toxin-antitoxin system AbiEi family antitoxin domain-containing protein, partial [Agromyces sp.]|nr:type IV toxin-antitoxin system AbiEi family antitoxin domain-containing protein [Agromyces sp.]
MPSTDDAGTMPHSLPVDQHGFIRFADVRTLGRQSELHAAVARGELEVARRGVYRAKSSVPEPGDDPGGVAERERLAYASNVRSVGYAFGSPIFTSYSAAVLLGLPIIGTWPSEIFILSRGKHGRRRSGVVEVARTRPIDVIEVDGCVVTSVEFTLLQLARHAPLVAALTAMDAALHVARFGDAEPMTTLERLRAEHERLKPYPRSLRADAVLDRATTQADTPLESGSRLLIEELGFAEPELQHELWLPELGKRAFLDFYWRDVNVGAEADGRGKYRGALDMTGVTRSASETSGTRRGDAGIARSAAGGAARNATGTLDAAAVVEAAAESAARRAADAVIGEKD